MFASSAESQPSSGQQLDVRYVGLIFRTNLIVDSDSRSPISISEFQSFNSFPQTNSVDRIHGWTAGAKLLVTQIVARAAWRATLLSAEKPSNCSNRETLRLYRSSFLAALVKQSSIVLTAPP